MLAKVVIGQNPFLRKLFRLPEEGSGKYSLFLQSSQQDGLTMCKGSVFYVWLVPEDNKLQCWRLRGADVVVVDASQDQLALDKMVAKRDNLSLRTVLGDMQDLSAFNDESFDLISHPISNLYVSNIQKVWAECYRVLCKGGKLLSSFYNPAVFVFERSSDLAKEGLMKPRFTLPYADITDLSEGEFADKIARNEAFVFGHTLAEQINGQLQAGLLLTGFEEAFQPTPRFLIDNYMPTFIATCSVKPR
ncbi:MAG: class I SAM-dependent methyltransferase [Pseudomonas sp.]|uniref:class I SAM-dependent methyltransferase n=1 Tax=Pseudomonas sp. TaxID=306 RepID=UPI002FC9E113